jgi:hypothetical protein
LGYELKVLIIFAFGVGDGRTSWSLSLALPHHCPAATHVAPDAVIQVRPIQFHQVCGLVDDLLAAFIVNLSYPGEFEELKKVAVHCRPRQANQNREIIDRFLTHKTYVEQLFGAIVPLKPIPQVVFSVHAIAFEQANQIEEGSGLPHSVPVEEFLCSNLIKKPLKVL